MSAASQIVTRSHAARTISSRRSEAPGKARASSSARLCPARRAKYRAVRSRTIAARVALRDAGGPHRAGDLAGPQSSDDARLPLTGRCHGAPTSRGSRRDRRGPDEARSGQERPALPRTRHSDRSDRALAQYFCSVVCGRSDRGPLPNTTGGAPYLGRSEASNVTARFIVVVESGSKSLASGARRQNSPVRDPEPIVSACTAILRPEDSIS